MWWALIGIETAGFVLRHIVWVRPVVAARTNRISMTMDGLDRDAEALVSTERLSSDSPVMWPDQNFFGDFNPLHLSPAPSKWLLDVQKEDVQMISELASLTRSELMQKVRKLQNLAYQLGVEEAKQMSRGKCLNVFEPDREKLDGLSQRKRTRQRSSH